MEPYIWVGIILAVSGTVAEWIRYSRASSSKLMQAAEKDDLAAFRKALRRRKVSINAPGALGDRPLHVVAAKWAHEGLLDEVIARGAVIDIRNIHGQTPLHVAVEHGNLEAIRTLLEHDADMNAQDRTGTSPLQLAVKKKRKRVLALLERYASR